MSRHGRVRLILIRENMEKLRAKKEKSKNDTGKYGRAYDQEIRWRV